MPTYPKLSNRFTRRELTDTFKGYNHVLKTGRGEFYDMENLSTAYFPMLSCRAPRGTVAALAEPQGLLAKEKLAWVEGGTLYYDGLPTALTGLGEGDKQLVSMGAYICVFPDKLYYNTADGTDYGSMEASYSSTGAVRYTLCKCDGSEYQTPTVSNTPPASPEPMQLWIDSSLEQSALKQWSQETEGWVEIPAVYTRLRFVSLGELPELFRKNDGVRISGSACESVNGEKIVCAVGGGDGVEDYIVVAGLLPQAMTQSEGSVHIERCVPDADFVCECQNRLWGCRYGSGDGGNVNEIFCCALGDFKNWRQFQGLSTDSWNASVGSDGPWTGAVNYLGSPMFFKENTIHTVTVSPLGAHRVAETVCRAERQREKPRCGQRDALLQVAHGRVRVSGRLPGGGVGGAGRAAVFRRRRRRDRGQILHRNDRQSGREMAVRLRHRQRALGQGGQDGRAGLRKTGGRALLHHRQSAAGAQRQRGHRRELRELDGGERTYVLPVPGQEVCLPL